MAMFARGKKVGLIECKKDEEGKLACTFQEIDKGEEGAVFSLVVAKRKDGEKEIIDMKNMNKRPIDPDSLLEAQKILMEQLTD